MNVLILTDLSNVARNAGSYAVQFLSKVPVNFYMLNIELFNPDLEQSRIQRKQELIIARINRRIEELKKISSNGEHKFTALYSSDNHISAARKYVEEKKIDLIVMGAACKGHSPRTIIGNLTYEIIKKVRCNILAVAENSRYRKVKKMILPIDYSISLKSSVFGFLNNPFVAEKASLMIKEMQKSNEPDGSTIVIEKKLLKLENKKVEVTEASDTEIFSEEHLREVQENYDMIVILGKNIRICDTLLHNRYGIYSNVANNLPILVLHSRDL